jgi:hypothetical protein
VRIINSGNDGFGADFGPPQGDRCRCAPQCPLNVVDSSRPPVRTYRAGLGKQPLRLVQFQAGSRAEGSVAQRVQRRFLEAGLVVDRKSTERAEAVGETDGGHGTTVPRGSGEFGARHVEAQRSQMRHRRGVAKAPKCHLQRPCTDPSGRGYVSQSDGLGRILLNETFGAAWQ